MAVWFELDSNEDGSYSYPTDELWAGGFDVYLAYMGRIPVGFGVIGSAEHHTGDARGKDVHEFFVMRRYRRAGVGRALAVHLWDAYPGPWVVRVYQRNLPAIPFWRGAIAEYTRGSFCEEVREVRERPWSFFTFESAG